MNRRIVTNAIRCRKCRTVIVSRHRHDFQWCPCKSVAVDGGTDYLKRTSDGSHAFEELSTYANDVA